MLFIFSIMLEIFIFVFCIGMLIGAIRCFFMLFTNKFFRALLILFLIYMGILATVYYFPDSKATSVIGKIFLFQ